METNVRISYVKDSMACRCKTSYFCLRHDNMGTDRSTAEQERQSAEDSRQQPQEKKPEQLFPTARRVIRREIDESKSQEELKKWVEERKITLGPLIPEEDKLYMMRVLWTYRDLESSGVEDLGPPTDLVQHRAMLREGTPIHKSRGKRMSPEREYQFRKYVAQGLKSGLFERTYAANGRLSPWAADPVMVQKPNGEWRLTFNYSLVFETQPGVHMVRADRVHEFLSASSHDVMSTFDLKNAYWTIPIHPDDRYIFAFYVPGVGQCQPTRMAQGGRASSFTMNELGNIALGEIPPPQPERSLIAPERDRLQDMTFYQDDMYAAHSSWRQHMAFLVEDFFPRMLWAMLRLSFSKMMIGMDKLVALGEMHEVGGKMTVRPERVRRILEWPVPGCQGDVRSFLGTVATTRRWVKNFGEISRPLTRLTGKVEWRWDKAEEASFGLLRIQCSIAGSRFGLIHTLPVDVFVDASGYSMGCFIAQWVDKEMRPLFYDSQMFTPAERNYDTYKKELKAIVTFVKKHGYMLQGEKTSTVWTDHKPLVGFINSEYHEDIFARWAQVLRKYNIKLAYIEGKRNQAADGLSRTIFNEDCTRSKAVDHLVKKIDEAAEKNDTTWFWKTGKGGYQDWLKEIDKGSKRGEINASRVSVQEGTKGWTTFGIPSPLPHHQVSAMAGNGEPDVIELTSDEETGEASREPEKVMSKKRSTESKGKSKKTEPKKGKVTKQKTTRTKTGKRKQHTPEKALPEVDIQDDEMEGADMDIPREILEEHGERQREMERIRSDWYELLEKYYRHQWTPQHWSAYKRRAFARQAEPFRWNEKIGRLQCWNGNAWVTCINPDEILPVLQETHDKAGHFSIAIVREKLRNRVFWPKMEQDIQAYIRSCIRCISIAKERQTGPLAPIDALRPFHIVGMDFVGRLPTTPRGNDHILTIVDYFSNYLWAEPVGRISHEHTQLKLTQFFNKITKPIVIYADKAFAGDDMDHYFRERGITYIPIPSRSHRSAGKIEVHNGILVNRLVASRTFTVEERQRATETGYSAAGVKDNEWDERVSEATAHLNRRYMATIGYSPVEILFGTNAGELNELEHVIVSEHRQAIVEMAKIYAEEKAIEGEVDGESWADFHYIAERQTKHARVKRKRRKEQETRKAAWEPWKPRRRLRKGDMVMVLLKKEEVKKLQPKWNGPFRLSGLSGDQGMSWEVENIEGRALTTVHEQHIIRIPPREGYLTTEVESDSDLGQPPRWLTYRWVDPEKRATSHNVGESEQTAETMYLEEEEMRKWQEEQRELAQTEKDRHKHDAIKQKDDELKRVLVRLRDAKVRK